MELKIKVKHLRKTVSKLQLQVATMVHYWKIRCKERQTYHNAYKKLIKQLSTVESNKKALSDLLGRARVCYASDHKSRTNQPLYPLFLTMNDRCRLKSFIKYNLGSTRLVFKKPSLKVPQLSHAQHTKLLKLLGA